MQLRSAVVNVIHAPSVAVGRRCRCAIRWRRALQLVERILERQRWIDDAIRDDRSGGGAVGVVVFGICLAVLAICHSSRMLQTGIIVIIEFSRARLISAPIGQIDGACGALRLRGDALVTGAAMPD